MSLRGGGLLRSRGRWLGGTGFVVAVVTPDPAKISIELGARPQTFTRRFVESARRATQKQVE